MNEYTNFVKNLHIFFISKRCFFKVWKIRNTWKVWNFFTKAVVGFFGNCFGYFRPNTFLFISWSRQNGFDSTGSELNRYYSVQRSQKQEQEKKSKKNDQKNAQQIKQHFCSVISSQINENYIAFVYTNPLTYCSTN